MADKPLEPPVMGRRFSSTVRRWILFAGGGLIFLIIAADTYEASEDYRRVIADNEHQQVALSRVLAEQTARMLQEADLAMASFNIVDDPAQAQRFLSQVMRLPFVYSAAVANAAGEWIARSPKEPAAASHATDLDVFSRPQHATDDALHIDAPRGGADGTPRTFALSRRVVSTDGTLAGVLMARVSLDYLADLYARIDASPHTAVRLARDDGVILAHYVPGDSQTADHHVQRADPGIQRPAEFVEYVQTNGHEQIEVSQRVDGYPVRVLISRSLSSVLQPWVQEELSSAERTLSLAALAALLLAALRSALNRQARIEEERLRLEHELAAVQRLEAIGLLAASVVHDFNNVLSGIIGYAELIRDDLQAESSSHSNTELSSHVHIERLLASTERARLLVRRVLTFDPHRSVNYHPTPVAPVLVEVSEQVQATLPGSIEFKVESPPQPLVVAGDSTEIFQVLMNLCSNAVFAMPSGGTLTLSLAAIDVVDPQALTLGQLTPGRWICVAVADSGVGLADGQIEAIFQPFHTTKNPLHGTGIGLTVVRNVILRMNGALKVESRLGSGTRMTAYWPAIAAPDVGSNAAESKEGSGETILIVDDQRDLVALTEELLASLGYEPVGYSDARAAIEAFRHNPKRFDAVLTDERMHPLGGLELARLIHECEPLLPIILMTGHRDAYIDRRAREEGIADILDKPLRVQALREALARLIPPG